MGFILPGTSMEAAIATSRFGLGAKPGEIEAADRDPRGWLRSQVRAAGADMPSPPPESSSDRLQQLYRNRYIQRQMRQSQAGEPEAMLDTPGERRRPPRDESRERRMKGDPDRARLAARAPQGGPREDEELLSLLRQKTSQDFLARTRLAVRTDAPFRERWSLFWANHFTVAGIKATTAPVVGCFEAEAIRPYVFGRFEDMLLASSQHPAMLLYLDQARSVGPNAPAGRGGRGLNENLAREILELHTLGVDGGYSQADVTEFARALTGWSIASEANPTLAGQYIFRDGAHEPGERTILGRRYRAGNEVQGREVLRDLAAHPATARFLARKIAIHFVADDPPPALVSRLERAYQASNGRLSEVALALIEAPEAWEPRALKIKSPYDYVVSCWRAMDHTPERIEAVYPILTSLGQKPFSAPSPKGWPEEAQTWAAPDALLKRMAWARQLAEMHSRDRDPNELARQALGRRLSERSAQAIARAESRTEALTLALMSPEFLRR